MSASRNAMLAADVSGERFSLIAKVVGGILFLLIALVIVLVFGVMIAALVRWLFGLSAVLFMGALAGWVLDTSWYHNVVEAGGVCLVLAFFGMLISRE